MITLGQLLDAGAALGAEARDAVVSVIDIEHGEREVVTVQYLYTENRLRLVVESA